ncbi:MAG: alpha/beta fold hydrolase [Selenomonadales bacterium]|nr:alpha/beta fold hydrolase [Selenomonadales bacterium]MBQ6713780.1 alpha/beta fold hydrolase [Selenomonadales bacterium]
MIVQEGAESFLLRGGRRGVLLIHGFTGSTSEVRELAEALHKQGYTVFAPRLGAHGTSPKELEATSWHEWYATVEDGYRILSQLCDEIMVAGHSMGGLFAILIALSFPVKRIAVLSAPIKVQDKRVEYLGLVSLVARFFTKKKRKKDVPYFNYSVMPLKSVQSLMALIDTVRRELPRLDKPILILQSRREHTVDPVSAQIIYDEVGSKDKKLRWLERSGHSIVTDQEREFVFREVIVFFNQSETEKESI